MNKQELEQDLKSWWGTGNNAKHTIIGAILFIAGMLTYRWIFG